MISGLSSSSGFTLEYFRLSASERAAVRADSVQQKAEASASQTDKAESDRVPAQARSSAGLDAEAQREVAQLAETDRKVRAHEQAHLSAGGNLVRGGATYEYKTGPDGKRYAVGGEVSIDTSEGRTPAETLTKAQRIYATAMAPADPSPQDRAVASMAKRMESQAAQDLAAQGVSAGKAAGSQAHTETAPKGDHGDPPNQRATSAYEAPGRSAYGYFSAYA